jgi:putative acetyltransferase
VRLGRSEDATGLARVFRASVEGLGPRDYAPDQVRAWCDAGPGDEAMRLRIGDGRAVFVALANDGRHVGYVDLEADGHIDQFYCAPAAAGTGVADRLYEAVEDLAVRRGVVRLRVEASEAARRFLVRREFVVDGRREVLLGGVLIHNFAMSKALVASI